MARIAWADLPPDAATALDRQLGSLLDAHDVEAGAGSDVAAYVYLDDATTTGLFVKGARADGKAWGPLCHEALVAPFAPACAPRLVRELASPKWRFLAFELVREARAWARFDVGSEDIPRAAEALAMVADTRAPDAVPTAWDRWGYWCDVTDQALFDGDILIHTDPAATNFLVDDERAWLVDWAWAARGPAWVDPMLWGGRLVIDGGHTPEQAAEVIRHLPGYRTGTARGRAMLAHGEASRIEESADPASLARDARAWADHWRRDLVT